MGIKFILCHSISTFVVLSNFYVQSIHGATPDRQIESKSHEASSSDSKLFEEPASKHWDENFQRDYEIRSLESGISATENLYFTFKVSALTPKPSEDSKKESYEYEIVLLQKALNGSFGKLNVLDQSKIVPTVDDSMEQIYLTMSDANIEKYINEASSQMTKVEAKIKTEKDLFFEHARGSHKNYYKGLSNAQIENIWYKDHQASLDSDLKVFEDRKKKFEAIRSARWELMFQARKESETVLVSQDLGKLGASGFDSTDVNVEISGKTLLGKMKNSTFSAYSTRLILRVYMLRDANRTLIRSVLINPRDLTWQSPIAAQRIILSKREANIVPEANTQFIWAQKNLTNGEISFTENSPLTAVKTDALK